ncbi:immune inhibitor A domain-containing protein [Fictibacillus barbaricus]|uniref:Immune inhibitor A n=1 Tax=Fictibacillus barbaricus TaxID=182136 RepID=A0ABU1U0L2_9BACL|nr:immune inhibitor A domain-containing protein [Fictibacillus barbaricus]MDR7072998.1 immune inhibitor A [Fictibacillus barbaricus]
MKKGKFVTAALAAMLSCSSFATVSAAPMNVLSDVKAPAVSAQSHNHGGPFDLAVANDDKLIEMLKENGQIKKNASAAEAQQKLQKFLQKKQDGAANLPAGELAKENAEKQDKNNKKHDKNGLKHGKKGKDKDVNPAKPENWTGGERLDNVLVLLVEYPDFPHNQIKSDETDMYYKDYTHEHYQDMIFGENGYKGPNGEKLKSVKQYYEAQSGGSYTITGKVGGWYKAQHPAAYYGGNNPDTGSDANARGLVKEALAAAAKDTNLNLSEFDQEDRYDLDGDGNTREPDGLVDHLMIVHSSVGEEAGGGQLGEDAIWSHRWNLGGIFSIPGSPTPKEDYWGANTMYAYDYTIEPADGAAGVFAHEYGHDLGLPDEYDTQYSGAGEPIAYWSIMSAGSWAGKIPGTEPTGFSAWSKEFLQSTMEGSNWLSGETLNLQNLDKKGTEVLLDAASMKGTNNDAVRVNLPKKETIVNTPFSGSNSYFSGKGNGVDNSFATQVDLTNAKSASLTFKTWYDIEQDFDYASIQVREAGTKDWTSIPGNLTTTDNPYDQNPGNGITGSSNGKWVDGTFDLSAYKGKNIDLKFNYWTDGGLIMPGFFVDDISLTVDGTQTLFDNAEGTSSFTGDFTKSNGKFYTDHYYLLEWRNHKGVDEGLAHIARGNSIMKYDSGLVVWYVDDKYTDNWTGIHPGDGFLGVVDADQNTLKWSDGSVASSRYQVHDAAFNKNRGEKMFLDYKDLLGLTMTDNRVATNHKFKDNHDYSNKGLVDAGRNVPNYGLEFEVVGVSKDNTAAKIKVSRDTHK